jgi:hypothetical protein
MAYLSAILLSSAMGVVMDTAKIKVKIGDHEFEAEGPADLVRDQFESFKNIISELTQESILIPATTNANSRQIQDAIVDDAIQTLEKILHVSGRVVSLTALPTSATDAALLIMLGHKNLRNHDSVTGQEIGDGLAQSGRGVPRVDRVMDKALEDAYVLKSGLRRGTRYRLTNQGLMKATAVAKDLIATLP